MYFKILVIFVSNYSVMIRERHIKCCAYFETHLMPKAIAAAHERKNNRKHFLHIPDYEILSTMCIQADQPK